MTSNHFDPSKELWPFVDHLMVGVQWTLVPKAWTMNGRFDNKTPILLNNPYFKWSVAYPSENTDLLIYNSVDAIFLRILEIYTKGHVRINNKKGIAKFVIPQWNKDIEEEQVKNRSRMNFINF